MQVLGHDHRFVTRRASQAAFLGLTLVGVFVFQANCEAWCPFGGVESLYGYLTEGNMVCSLAVSNFYILGGVLAMTLLLRRAFCGYMCPIGTISEWLHSVGLKLRLPRRNVPRSANRVLSLLKYVVLAIILYATWRTGELMFRGYDPCYALLSRHGEDIQVWAYVVAGAIVLGSLVLTVPFCRWFCPLAAVLQPFSRAGLTRVRRNEAACANCGSCAKACPMQIPVDRLPVVQQGDCTSCMSCVAACEKTKKHALAWGPPASASRWLGRHWSQAALVLIMLGCTAGAVTTSYLAPLPSFVKTRQEPVSQTEHMRLKVDGLTCRGRANLFFWYLDRDDEFRVPGYLRFEAWPGPNLSAVEIHFDASTTSKAAIQRAITEPYFDLVQDRWRMSPFSIEGYDPLDAELELDDFEF